MPDEQDDEFDDRPSTDFIVLSPTMMVILINSIDDPYERARRMFNYRQETKQP